MTFRVAGRLQARGFPNRRRPHDDIPGGRGFPALGQFSMPGREVRNDDMESALAASPEHAGWLRSHGHAATFAVPMSGADGLPGLVMCDAGRPDGFAATNRCDIVLYGALINQAVRAELSVPGIMALAGKLDRECVAALRARPDEILAIAGRYPDDDAVCRNEGMSC